MVWSGCGCVAVLKEHRQCTVYFWAEREVGKVSSATAGLSPVFSLLSWPCTKAGIATRDVSMRCQSMVPEDCMWMWVDAACFNIKLIHSVVSSAQFDLLRCLLFECEFNVKIKGQCADFFAVVSCCLPANRDLRPLHTTSAVAQHVSAFACHFLGEKKKYVVCSENALKTVCCCF